MAQKLIKACKELNIGMATAIEFFQKQGKTIAADPNTRIDDDLYMLLVQAFNKDMAIKLEADRQAQERQEREIAKSVSIEDDKKEQERIEKARREAEEARLKAEAEKARIEAEKEARRLAEQQALEEARRKAEEEEKLARGKAQAEAEEQARRKAEEEEKLAREKAQAAEEARIAKEAQNAQNAKQEEKKEPKIFTLHPQTAPAQPKVVGKIDLDSLNQATRPQKKSKEEKKKEREERKQAQNNNNNGNNNGKRKRERIQQNKVDVNDVRNQKSNKSKGNNKRPVKVEIDDEEVQRQIKETLNRLQSQKGKTLTSKHKRDRRQLEREKLAEEKAEQQAQSTVLKLTEFVTANDLAVMMNVPVTKIIGTCMSLGMMVSINQRLDAETINIVAEEFGFTTEYVDAQVVEDLHHDDETYDEADIEERCPIITVMGHVDHGKTSLLDHIRNTNVIAGEAGGITQHIGAYNVRLKNGRHLTFLDTPGHEAFTAMRARGAKVTDIAIIIVAADDGVMPQTREAISHAQAAGVPMIFAINKCDKPGANPEKIKEELANMNLLVEDWGGKYQSQDISAKKGTGVYELLEKVLLEADMLDLKANPKRRAKGSIIESSLDKGRGYVSTLLVSDGTLHIGDVVLAGSYHGKVKAMFNERGQNIEQALPGEPAVILGLNGAPTAGDEFNVMPSEQEARQIANKREQLQREMSIRTKKHIGLEEIGRRLAIGDFKELNLIVKADVDGSVEALSDSLIKLSTENIQVNVIHKGVGAISDSDILLAEASDAIIIGFNVRATATARKMADTAEVDVRIYNVIYDAIEEVKAAMAGMLSPEIKENVTATLEVLQTFHISKVGTIAGCVVREGKIKRQNKVRVIRDGIVIFTGDLASLKHGKDDVKEMGVNQECGVSIRSYNDLVEGDMIESFEEVEVAKTL
ncbi:MAG: translation initiation factor IF-2 [Paludibacteraceae bacterium]|nr:translation initiation factor IF-2 [Paludibacteraceae bacterium]